MSDNIINKIITATRGIPSKSGKFIFDISNSDLSSLSIVLENETKKSLHKRSKIAFDASSNFKKIKQLIYDLDLDIDILYNNNFKKIIIAEVTTTKVILEVPQSLRPENNISPTKMVDYINELLYNIVINNNYIYTYKPTTTDKIVSFLRGCND